MKAVYEIPVPRFWELEEKIGRVNKRAAKTGFAPVVLTVLSSEMRQHGVDDHKRPIFIAWYHVEIDGETPKFAGWTFAATLDHVKGGNVIRSVPGAPQVPEAYRTAPSACDHCEFIRTRKDTFLVVNDAGEWKQIGRQCIGDFLGGADPHHYAQMCAHLRDIFGLASGDGEYGGHGNAPESTSVFSVLSWAAAAIRQFGWTSRTAARDHDGLRATVDRVRGYWNAPRGTEEAADVFMESPTDEDRLTAFATIQHWNAASDRSDYEYNVRLVLSQGTIEPKQEGIAMSAVSGYLRAVDRMVEYEKRESRRAKESAHVGTVSERSVFESLEIIGLKVRTTEFGYATTVTFMDPDGQTLKWFASGELDETVWAKGVVKSYVATVKGHGVWQERKETSLTRVAEYVPKPPKKPRKAAQASTADVGGREMAMA